MSDGAIVSRADETLVQPSVDCSVNRFHQIQILSRPVKVATSSKQLSVA